MSEIEQLPIIQEIRRLEGQVRGQVPHASDRKTYEAARELAYKLGDILNGGSSGVVVAGLVEGLIRQHRYLQNETIIALLTALGEVGRLPDTCFVDPRNEFGFNLCRKLRQDFRDDLFWRDK